MKRPVLAGRSLRYGAIAVALTLLYAALVFINAERHLWFDELLTFEISKTPDLGRMFQLVKRWDLSPPTAHLLARYAMRLFGENALAVRLPSIIEFYVASLMLLWYTSRKAGYAYGLAALLLLWGSPAFYYATEARPYALLSMWFGCLLVSWDFAVTAPRRTLALWGIAISSFGLVESHAFAPLSLLPFVAAEALRWMKSRKPDYPVWLALLLPAIGVVGYVPLYQSYKAITFYPFPFQASFKKMASFYCHGARDILWYLCVALSAAILANKIRVDRRRPEKFRSPDAVLFAVLLANPILLNLVLMRDHAAFWPRYCITSAFGIYVLFALCLATAFRSRAQPAYAASLALGGMILLLKIAMPMDAGFVQDSKNGASAAFARVKPALPLVAASGLTFVEMNHYEPAAILSRLYYLEDRAAAIRYAHATLFEHLDRLSRDFAFQAKVEEYPRFTREHHEFLVLGTFAYPEDWLLRKLAAEQARIVLIGNFSLPYKDTTLYDVTLPEPRP